MFKKQKNQLLKMTLMQMMQRNLRHPEAIFDGMD